MANSANTAVGLTSSTARQSQLAIVEPDDAAWDAFAQSHPQGHMLQSAGWGALKSRFGWERRRLAIAGPAGLIAGAQVLLRRRLGISGAYVPRGPLFAGDAPADTLLLAALDRLARRNRAVFLRLEPNMLEDRPEAATLHSSLLLAGFRPAATIQPRSSIHLDLRPTADHLFAAFSKGHRADIRRAERGGVAVRAGANEQDLDTFAAIMESTGARAGFAVHSRAYYRAAWDLLGHASAAPDAQAGGHALLLLAERAGTPLAGFLVFAWAGAGLYLYSGATEEGLKSGANHALQWQALQWAKRQGCAIYDFWGIPDALGQAAAVEDPNERMQLEQQAQADPLAGVFRFKKGFGGQVVRFLPAYDRVYIPALYMLWQRRLGG
jgi:lipid II:glycine glycyltransferase (peptidoglycan interpeptide bridge formation enzyme)